MPELNTWVDRIVARLARGDRVGALRLAELLDRTIPGVYEDYQLATWHATLPEVEGGHVEAWQACPTCRWTGGWWTGKHWVECPECGGLGKLPTGE